MIDVSEPSPGDGSGASGSPRRPVTLRLDLSYDGGPFHGFAENRGVRTVGGDLRAALEQIMGTELTLTVAGRTDTGVHAMAQVVSIEVQHLPERAADLERLRDSLNSMLAPAIAVSSVRAVEPDFNARFSARWRSYRYQVLTDAVPDPFLAGRVWWVDSPLDVAAMNEAAAHLLGEHDFSSFCRRPRGRDDLSLVRRVTHAAWSTDPADARLLLFDITASAFCHQMVRSITGTLVSIGLGRRSAGDVPAMLAAADRDGMAKLAPPDGLYLAAVGYEPLK